MLTLCCSPLTRGKKWYLYYLVVVVVIVQNTSEYFIHPITGNDGFMSHIKKNERKKQTKHIKAVSNTQPKINYLSM